MDSIRLRSADMLLTNAMSTGEFSSSGSVVEATAESGLLISEAVDFSLVSLWQPMTNRSTKAPGMNCFHIALVIAVGE
jgi:hypothetical protein